jgi:hypothetical protein
MFYIAVAKHWQDHGLNVIEKKGKRKMCGPKTVEVTVAWRICHNVNEMGSTGKTRNGYKFAVGMFGRGRQFDFIEIGCFSACNDSVT